MAIEFLCEHCGKLLSADARAGDEVTCPHCENVSVVPEGLASLPSPQVPGQETPEPPAEQSEPGEEPPQDEESLEEEQLHHEHHGFMRVMAEAMPWMVSVFVHAAVLLVLTLWVMINILDIKPEQVPVADPVLSQNPGGAVNPTQTEMTESTTAVNPTTTRQFSERESPVIDTGETSDDVSLIGLGGGGGGGDPFGSTGTGGGGPGGMFGGGGNMHNIVFLVDRSGSMHGTFEVVRKEMLRYISRLDPKQEFHVILFATGEPLEKDPAKLTPATDEFKMQAGDFLDEVRAFGQTDPIPAMERAFEVLRFAKKDKPGKLIQLLTDGSFPDNRKTIQVIEDLNPRKEVHIRTHLFGRHDPVAEQVLKTIAEQNGGTYHYVSPDEAF